MSPFVRQARRISGTVHAFVMLMHNICNRPWELYSFQYVITNLSMGLHNIELILKSACRAHSRISAGICILPISWTIPDIQVPSI